MVAVLHTTTEPILSTVRQLAIIVPWIWLGCCCTCMSQCFCSFQCCSSFVSLLSLANFHLILILSTPCSSSMCSALFTSKHRQSVKLDLKNRYLSCSARHCTVSLRRGYFVNVPHVYGHTPFNKRMECDSVRCPASNPAHSYTVLYTGMKQCTPSYHINGWAFSRDHDNFMQCVNPPISHPSSPSLEA